MASQLQVFTQLSLDDDGPNTLDFDSNDELDDNSFNDDNDLLNYDGDSPFSSDPRLCIICKKKPPYSAGGKSYPTCGTTCGRKLEEAITSMDPNEATTNGSRSNNAKRDGHQRQWRAETDRGTSQPHAVGRPSSSNGQHGPEPSINPNIRLLAQHLGGHSSHHRQGAAQKPITSPTDQPPVQTQAPPTRRRANRLPVHTLPSTHQPRPRQNLPQSFRQHAQQQEDDTLFVKGRHEHWIRWVSPPSHASQASSPVTNIAYINHTNDGRSGGQGRPATVHSLRQQQPPGPLVACVVCRVKTCRDGRYVTCGLTCAEELCKTGSNDPSKCDYCHRRPKLAGYNQCGTKCRDSAKTACLLCKSRPKFGRYHLCGKSCKQIAIKSTPLLLEAPHGHSTFEQVEKKFKDAWKVASPSCPPIKKIFKIIENKAFLQPYDRYKKTHGNEVFRYHGTSRKCTLGTGTGGTNTQLCNDNNCALCNILKTSFKTSLANPSGAFGPGIYTSSASNKSYSYTGGGNGVIILTKVILGKPRMVAGWNEVMSCPAGFNSVVFDRNNGTLNETIVYSDDSIRPVFLIVF